MATSRLPSGAEGASPTRSVPYFTAPICGELPARNIEKSQCLKSHLEMLSLAAEHVRERPGRFQCI